MNDATTLTHPSTSSRGLIATGLLAALAATVATTIAAALAQAIGVNFELPDGAEAIPLSGFTVVTAFFSVVGIVLALAFHRWSTRPANRFLWTTIPLTAISLAPPLLAGGNAGTTIALVVLHLIPAAVMIPALTRSLRAR